MRQRHVTAYGFHSRETIRSIGAHVGQDFFTLSSGQIEMLLEEADRVKYRVPKNANGSRARYFYALLTRRATAKSKD